MNFKFVKKIVISLIAFIMIFAALPIDAFAEGNLDSDIVTYEEVEDSKIDLEELSEKELKILDEVIETAISEQEKKDSNFDEVQFTEDVEAFMEGDADHFLVEEETQETGFLAAIDNFFFVKAHAATKKGKIRISNGVVATGVNAAVSLAIGGATTYALKTIILKKGATYVTNLLVKKIVAKLLAIGIKEATGIGTLIRTIVKNVLDPGSTVAKWLDRGDRYPGNGFYDLTS